MLGCTGTHDPEWFEQNILYHIVHLILGFTICRQLNLNMCSVHYESMIFSNIYRFEYVFCLNQLRCTSTYALALQDSHFGVASGARWRDLNPDTWKGDGRGFFSRPLPGRNCNSHPYKGTAEQIISARSVEGRQLVSKIRVAWSRRTKLWLRTLEFSLETRTPCAFSVGTAEKGVQGWPDFWSDYSLVN